MPAPAQHIAILGASGFLGATVAEVARTAGIAHERLPVTRVGPAGLGLASVGRTPVPPGTVAAAAGAWRRSHGLEFDRLCRSLAGFDVVVNAAGCAAPGSTDRPGLFAADAVMPAVVAAAAALAGVRRLVHVSTAAVQGRMEPLDETPRLAPLSPYGEAKAEAERFLLAAGAGGLPPEIVVYRPASVHGTGRTVTTSLARLAGALPVVPVAGRGDRPVPVALVENVAAGVLVAATSDRVPPIVLHPWEGLTARRLLELFGARRVVAVPGPVMTAGLRAAGWAARRHVPATARLRRLELVVRGQAMRAERLEALGFRAPLGIEGWERLAADERGRLGGRDRHRRPATGASRAGVPS